MMKAALDQAVTRVRPRLYISPRATRMSSVSSRQTLSLRSSKLLQVQSAFQSYVSPWFYSTNATSALTMGQSSPQISTEHQREINRIVDYWFTPSSPDASITQK